MTRSETVMLPREPLLALLGETSESERRVISLIGAGGKTSLLYALARGLRHLGRGVICTTTTRILPPTSEQCPMRLLLEGCERSTAAVDQIVEVFLRRKERFLAVSYREDVATGKWLGIPPAWVDALRERVPAGTVILVEADGAARHMLKAPAAYEPVLPERTDCCIAVLGLDAVGKAFDATTTHRIELAEQVTGQRRGSLVSGETLARLVNHQDGVFRQSPGSRRVVLCNKLDLERGDGRLLEAARIASTSASRVFWSRHPEWGVPPMWYAGSIREDVCILLSSSSKACQSEARECTAFP